MASKCDSSKKNNKNKPALMSDYQLIDKEIDESSSDLKEYLLKGKACPREK